MTAGIPGGQQDLDDFQKQSLPPMLRRKELTPCLSDLQEGKPIRHFPFPKFKVKAEHSMSNNTSV